VERLLQLDALLHAPPLPGASLFLLLNSSPASSALTLSLCVPQVLQSRLSQLRNSAAVLALPPPMEPITPSHVPTLSMSLSYAPPGSTASGWSDSPDYYYHRALGICEKMFDGDIDQTAFEDGIRRIMATQGYVLFTIDKTLTSILKLVRPSSSRCLHLSPLAHV